MAVNLPSDPKERLNWSRMDPDKAAGRIDQMVQAHERSLSWRHYMALRGAAAWSGVGLGDLFQNLSPYDGPNNQGRRRGRKNYAYGGWGSQVGERWARAAVETIHEKLTGLDEPKTQNVATDCPYETKRQGIWADRFIEGNFHQKEGVFQDTWDLCRHGWLVAACSTGTVAVRTEPDYVSKRVRNTLRSTLQTFIDPGDIACDMPLTYVDVTWENPEYMIEDPRWKGKEDALWKASVVPPHQVAGNYDGATFGTRMVKKVTAWRMPFGSFKGRHAVFVGGGTGNAGGSDRGRGGAAVLLWDDWQFPHPPLAFLRMTRCIGETFWGENLIEIMLDPLRDAEDIDDMAKQTMSRSAQTEYILDGKTQAPADVLNARDVRVLRYDSRKGEKPPQINKPGILHADHFNWRDRKIQTAKELLGVPDLHITSATQSPSASGRSKRLEASLLPERYARKMRSWRHWIAVDIAKNQINAAREIGKVEPKWQVTWPGADFQAKVPVKVLDYDDTQYELRPYPVSENKNTPQDRADWAEELFEQGTIDKEQLALINGGLYDTPSEVKQADSARRYVASEADKMLMSEPENVEDENAYMALEYQPPDPWIDPGAAMAQLIPMYRNARVDGVPQNRLNLLKRFMQDLVALDMQNKKDSAMQNATFSGTVTPGQAFPGAAGPMQDPNAPAAALGAPVPPPGAPGGEAALAAPPGLAPPTNVAGPPGIG
jgi:hypothetical protein